MNQTIDCRDARQRTFEDAFLLFRKPLVSFNGNARKILTSKGFFHSCERSRSFDTFQGFHCFTRILWVTALRNPICHSARVREDTMRSIAGSNVSFKGRTGLSKGWNYIETFSEDIEISFEFEAFDLPIRKQDGFKF
jgi:hypothetical protein